MALIYAGFKISMIKLIAIDGMNACLIAGFPKSVLEFVFVLLVNCSL